MAVVTITGYTASKMQEIELASVVSGKVVGDNLILTTKGNTTVNAGSVRGIQGPKGDAGGVWDATSSLNGAIRLAGNLNGTASTPYVTGVLGPSVDLSAAKGTATIPVIGAVTKTIAELIGIIYAAVPKSGRTTALWSGTQAEYDSLSTAVKNAEGFVAVIKP